MRNLTDSEAGFQTQQHKQLCLARDNKHTMLLNKSALSSVIIILTSVFKAQFSQAAATFETSTILTGNHGPIISTFLIPQTRYKPTGADNQLSVNSQLDITNYISLTRKGKESIAIDGETWRYSQSLGYQFSKHLYIEVNASYLKHFGGYSDRFIYHFHDQLGLPQNGRRDDRHDQSLWSISYNGESLVHLDGEAENISDTRVTLLYKPKYNESSQWSLNIKLPTGNKQDFTSSGSTDINLTYAIMNPNWFKNRSLLKDSLLAFWYGGGFGFLGKLEQLEELKQNHVVASLQSGIAWQALDYLNIKAQIDTHSRLYNSELRELGWSPIQATIGIDLLLNKQTELNFFLVEDLRPRSVPDMTFSSAINFRF